MGLRARILRMVGQTGPRKYTVLVGLARTPKQKRLAKKIVDAMRRDGELINVGSKRKGAVYDIRRERVT